MLKGFKNFLMRGDVIVIAIGLVVALALSTLIKAFTTDVIFPLVSRIQGRNAISLGIQLGARGNTSTFINFGDFIATIIYFFVFMAVVYFLIVVPYRSLMGRRGIAVFGEPAPTKECPMCRSDDIPLDAVKCKYCASDLPAA